MIKGQCNHHKILETLSISGHGNKVLIADGNFPIMTNSNHNAEKVYLGLSKDLPTVTDVLKSILTVINIENVEVMDSAEKVEPEILMNLERLQVLSHWRNTLDKISMIFAKMKI
ncbi:RbsD/FucU domain-containing protein [Mammaliicoccus sciuri]|uniref:RbsD/FucU domain-containing protein n=1 Tax=Mammaliicoccus sciuri TaxID=1296 RepID=UPI0018CAAB14|nr:RbsD/FucU domain-containing protein [Mammaliicoccus sciuri]